MYIVVGSKGQVGRELVQILESEGLEHRGFDLPDIDICSQPSVEALRLLRPKYIFNLAAYTNVDKAEIDAITCYNVNALGCLHLSKLALEVGAKLIHVSTDYVFSGDGNKAYDEGDTPNPMGVYGGSKFLGEEIVRRCNGESLIVRTSSVYGRYGHNFVATMLKLFASREQIEVVSDQVMRPTNAKWLAKTLLSVRDEVGILHAAGGGELSWHEFAIAIQKASGVKCGEKFTEIDSITAAAYSERYRGQNLKIAPRPAYSVLNTSRLERIGSVWSLEEGIGDFLNDLNLHSC